MNNNNQTRGKGGKVSRQGTLPRGAIIIINKLCDLGANNWELILEHQISKDPLLWEIVRLGREN
ncbi:MAG: hypothetical protein HC849_16400 [Oscillatoriales cyanobacterium RU_3_3]|nr:hypothetical protein [Oscillatoriales cyanobacterium RU_3_3]NJR25223.1 hypothetical protein [Richelia sp. CSU_2_1]